MNKTTEIVKKIRDTYGDEEAAKMIDMSRNTMYSRIKFGNWRAKEVSHIKKFDK